MRIMGVDLGLRELGYAVLEKSKVVKAGKIKVKSKNPLEKRVYTIYEEFKRLLDDLNPDIVVYESAFYSVNPRSYSALSLSLGAVLIASAEKGKKVEELTPAEIKKSITGKGNAGKNAVKYMVSKILNIEKISDEHISDAIACALCYQMRSENE